MCDSRDVKQTTNSVHKLGCILSGRKEDLSPCVNRECLKSKWKLLIINTYYCLWKHTSCVEIVLWAFQRSSTRTTCFSIDSHWLFIGAAVAEWLSSWLAEQEDRGSIPRLATWIFRDWLSPASKSRYGWKIAKSTLILKTTNQPTHWLFYLLML